MCQSARISRAEVTTENVWGVGVREMRGDESACCKSQSGAWNRFLKTLLMLQLFFIHIINKHNQQHLHTQKLKERFFQEAWNSSGLSVLLCCTPTVSCLTSLIFPSLTREIVFFPFVPLICLRAIPNSTHRPVKLYPHYN